MTTITKKTTLLKKLNHLVVSEPEARFDGYDMRMTLNCQPFDAIKGYYESAGEYLAPAKYALNGGEPIFVELIRQSESGACFGMLHEAKAGDEVTLTIEVNPAKTDFDQTPIVRTFVVQG